MVKQKKRFTKSPQLHISPEHIQNTLRVGDLRDLITWCLCNATPPAAPKWIGVENKNGVEHIVSLMVPGLPVKDLIDLNNPKPQHITVERVSALEAFEYGWATKANAHKDRIEPPENSISQVQFTKAEKKAQSKARKELEEKELTDPVPLSEFLVPENIKRQLGFVLEPPSTEWKETNLSGASEFSEMTRAWAIDCEMCLTTSGNVLTRVSVVDEKLACIYSTFVKPKEPIIDYLTQFSGITPELLEGVTTTLEDVQQWFIENVTPGTVLVGHSIDCDLNVLKLLHRHCIDTGLLYPHPKGLPFRHALKWLARKFLGQEIQEGKNGHDPTEDAATCIHLLNLKRRKGTEFGNFPLAKSLTQVLKDEGKTTAIIDYGVPFWDWTQSAQSVISTTSDQEVVDQIRKQCTKHSYTFAALRQLEKATPENYEQALAATNVCIQDVLNLMPSRAILIVWSGYGDRSEMFPLLERRSKWRREFRIKSPDQIEDKWTAEDNDMLCQSAQAGRLGISMVKMIPGELPRKAAKLSHKSTPHKHDSE